MPDATERLPGFAMIYLNAPAMMPAAAGGDAREVKRQ